MEKPTAKTLEQFHALFDEFKALQIKASEAIALAKENKDAEITIARNGKPLVVKEGVLWDEVWALGPESDAGKILSEKYPEPFLLSRQAEEKKKEIKTFAYEKWNVDPIAMTLSDIVRIIELVVDYKLERKS